MKIRVLGVDPSIRRTGYAVLEVDGPSWRALTFGAVANSPSRSQADCLVAIHDRLLEVMEEFHPQSLAIEQVLYAQNTRTSIVLGAARGAALMAAARCGLTITEYPAKSVKKAATGVGGARKDQVEFMMRALLGLTEMPGPDEADALAVAMTHAQSLRCRQRDEVVFFSGAQSRFARGKKL